MVRCPQAPTQMTQVTFYRSPSTYLKAKELKNIDKDAPVSKTSDRLSSYVRTYIYLGPGSTGTGAEDDGLAHGKLAE